MILRSRFGHQPPEGPDRVAPLAKWRDNRSVRYRGGRELSKSDAEGVVFHVASMPHPLMSRFVDNGVQRHTLGSARCAGDTQYGAPRAERDHCAGSTEQVPIN
jgi:hypothetical protein